MKFLLTTILLLLLPLTSMAQYDVEDVKNDSSETKEPAINPYKLRDKLYVGSGLNLLFGNTTFFYVSPMVGYDITDKFSAGIGTMYQFYRQNVGGGNFYNSNSFGVGVFTRFRPIEPLILETSINTYRTTYNGSNKEKANSWMLGAGYASSLGSRAYYQVMLQYDLLRDPNVPEPALLKFPNGSGVYYKFGIVFYLANN